MKRGIIVSSARVEALPADDVDPAEVQRCLEASNDYFRAAEGREVGPNDALDLCGEADADASRLVFLLRDRGTRAAVGVVDLALDHPTRGEATLALLLLVPSARRRGLGREVAAATVEALRSLGFRAVRLGVRRGAAGAAEFWASLGFDEIGDEDGVREFLRRL